MGVVRQFFRNEVLEGIADAHGNEFKKCWKHGVYGWFVAELREFLNEAMRRGRNGRPLETFMEDTIRADVNKFFKQWRDPKGHVRVNDMAEFVESVVKDEVARILKESIKIEATINHQTPVTRLHDLRQTMLDQDQRDMEDLIVGIDPDRLAHDDHQKLARVMRRMGCPLDE
jgi:hypothetical protein